MKPTVKRQISSVERNTQKEKQRERGTPTKYLVYQKLDFEVLLQGGNQERVQKKRVDGDKRLPPREVKQWNGNKSKNTHSQSKLDDITKSSALGEHDPSIQLEDLQSLDQGDLEILRKSLIQPGYQIFSQEQRDMLKRLSEDQHEINEKFNPHFSRLHDQNDYDEDIKPIEEEDPVKNQLLTSAFSDSEQTENSIDETPNSDQVDESIEEEDFENSKDLNQLQQIEIKIDPIVPPTKSVNIVQSQTQRKSIQPQKVNQMPPQQPQIQQQKPLDKNRPISAVPLNQIEKKSVKEVVQKQQQPTTTNYVEAKIPTKKINTNPFSQNRPKSVVQSLNNQLESQIIKKSDNVQVQSAIKPSLQEETNAFCSNNHMNYQLERFLKRIERMDEEQRKQLESMISIIERGKVEAQSQGPNFIIDSKPQLQLQNHQRSPIQKFGSPPQHQFEAIGTDEKSNTHTLVITILSTWGSSSMVGLTEVQLFDINGQKIDILPANLKLRNTQSIKPIDILINNNFMTNNAANMWLASLPDWPQNVEIEIKYIHEHALGGIVIFNYNKSLIDCGKGVKDVQLKYQKDKEAIREFNVVVQKGNGHDMEYYGTEIVIENGFIFKSTNIQEQVSQPYQYQELNLQESVKIDSKIKVDFTDANQDNLKPPPSRRQRGPLVYNIFKEDETLVRVKTAKSTKNSDNVKGQEDQLKVEANFYEQQMQNELLQTLKYFDLNNASKTQLTESQVNNGKQIGKDIFSNNPQKDQGFKKFEEDKYDALDMFFKQQQNGLQKITTTIPSIDSQQQQQIYNHQQEGKKTKQTEINAQLVKQIIDDNQNQMQKFGKQKSSNELNPQIQQIKQIQLNPEEFRIPILPSARYITIKIYSTWGDKFYVGLNGIELFDEFGQIIEIVQPKRQIKADPADINTLPEYDGDPRTPEKLVDGVYLTQSDLHVWLAPFTIGKTNIIYIDLLEKKKISLLRIWNYNKSRIHSFRGVKDISITLDKQLVFTGTISKAPGSLSFKQLMNEQLFEYILFSDDQTLLNQISKRDWINQINVDNFQQALSESMLPRPQTGNYNENRPTTSAKVQSLQNEVKQARLLALNEAERTEKKKVYLQGKGVHQNKLPNDGGELMKPGQKGIVQDYETISFPQGFDLKIQLVETYGDVHYIGLNGIEVYDSQGNPLIGTQNNIPSISASPSSIRVLANMSNDPRVPQNLIKEPNETFDDKFMWLSPFVNRYYDQPIENLNEKLNTIYLSFDQPIQISAISFWNYTKTPERGTREVAIWLDDYLIYKGFIRISQSQTQFKKETNLNQSVILFCKNPVIMEKFAGKYYNELEAPHKVNFHNEKKKGNTNQQQNYTQLDRPITSVQTIH